LEALKRPHEAARLPLSPRTSIVKHRAACLAALYLLFLLGFDPDLFSLPEAIK
jgi:hypothetical protein